MCLPSCRATTQGCPYIWMEQGCPYVGWATCADGTKKPQENSIFIAS
jgi:hypothetical protein